MSELIKGYGFSNATYCHYGNEDESDKYYNNSKYVGYLSEDGVGLYNKKFNADNKTGDYVKFYIKQWPEATLDPQLIFSDYRIWRKGEDVEDSGVRLMIERHNDQERRKQEQLARMELLERASQYRQNPKFENIEQLIGLEKAVEVFDELNGE